MFDLLRPERRAVYEAGIRDGLIPSPPPEVFGIAEPARAAWTAERLTAQPLATWTEPLPAASSRAAAPTSAAPKARSPLVRGLRRPASPGASSTSSRAMTR